MITAHLQGGLGNQLFQICAAISLALQNDDDYAFDINHHHLPNQGNSCRHYKENIFRNIKFNTDLPIKHIYHEPYFHYKKINYFPNLGLSGYFQSEKYFKDQESTIRKLFSIDDPSYSIIKNKYGTVLKNKTVALHVRRGDYLKFSDHHTVCTLDYYNKAINLFDEDFVFLIFSDDLEWCKTKFIGTKFLFIENNEDYIDFYLISLCKHVILSNSSFSWWGAWLNNHENKLVLVPDQWFGPALKHNTKDLIPSDWKII
jgi:hypothetical protein